MRWLLVITGMVFMVINVIKTFQLAKGTHVNPVLIPVADAQHA